MRITENDRISRSKRMIKINDAKWSSLVGPKTRLIDLTGKRFGKLVVMEIRGKNKYSYLWLCKCDCGKEIIKTGYSLKYGGISGYTTKSCGCSKHGKFSIERKVKHKVGTERHKTAISEEINNFIENGFKCIRLDHSPIPDFIAMKDGKAFAVEVEFGFPNVSKYSNNNPQLEYADIIWIKREKKSSTKGGRKI